MDKGCYKAGSRVKGQGFKKTMKIPGKQEFHILLDKIHPRLKADQLECSPLGEPKNSDKGQAKA